MNDLIGLYCRRFFSLCQTNFAAKKRCFDLPDMPYLQPCKGLLVVIKQGVRDLRQKIAAADTPIERLDAVVFLSSRRDASQIAGGGYPVLIGTLLDSRFRGNDRQAERSGNPRRKTRIIHKSILLWPAHLPDEPFFLFAHFSNAAMISQAGCAKNILV